MYTKWTHDMLEWENCDALAGNDEGRKGNSAAQHARANEPCSVQHALMVRVCLSLLDLFVLILCASSMTACSVGTQSPEPTLQVCITHYKSTYLCEAAYPT